jgi:RNA polymerase sigma factor (sigma-70 family)
MAARHETLLRYIRRLVLPPSPDDASDAALLGRFIEARDEHAFAALVERHGPQVLQVCWRVLGNVEDAEDAFQAAFLVLARKAETVRPREALAAWLHGVARRVALKVRSTRARHLRQAGSLAAPAADPRPDPLTELSARELLAILDEEVQRLPEMYRLPVILCCLQGRSQEEAARQLGWTPGSVKGRLERGRARLHQRLVRRGLTLGAALAAAEVSRSAASATVVAPLVAATARGAVLFAAHSATGRGVSTTAAALAGEMLRGMALARLKVPALLLLATSLLATGLLTYRVANPPAAEAPRADSPPQALPETAPAAAAAVADQAPPPDDFNAPVQVSGRVLDPDGRPLAAVNLYVGYSPRPSPYTFAAQAAESPVRTTSEADGRFHFKFARSELDARLLDTWRPAVAAVADGYGPDWAMIGDSGTSVELTLHLVKDLPINGRILDQDHHPVAGAEVRVQLVQSATEADLTRYLHSEVDAQSWSPRTWWGPFPGQPPVLKTDAEGRFQVTGIGRDSIVTLAIEGPAIRETVLTAVARPAAESPFLGGKIHSANFEYQGSAPRLVRGVVRDSATGKPIAGVQVGGIETSFTSFSTLTDREGRYELRCWDKSPKGYRIAAQPLAGQPYFTAAQQVPDEPGSGPLTVNFDLVGGLAVHGRVTDQATQEPPSAAVVEYYPLFPNAHSAALSNRHLAASSCPTRPDGSYSLVALPGPGIICVAASPRDAYAVAVLDKKDLAILGNDPTQLLNPLPDGWNCPSGRAPHTAVGKGDQGVLRVDRYSAMALIHPEETAKSLALDLMVQPACTLRGTVVGPDGKPLSGVRVVGLKAIAEDEVLEGPAFTVRGLNPQRSRELYFHQERLGLGKFLTIEGNETTPLTVRLEPCGTVVGRVVDRAGRPVAGANISLARYADGSPLSVAARETDGQGRFRADLVPGPRYAFWEGPRPLLRGGGEVKVEPGRSTDLGDLVVDDGPSGS